ncbi:MAG: hypothetical protein K6G58_07220 [Lachnospiraceae bacterium]|nr:hypothetical protein [Lachnospiraceae bacterium]
MTKKKKAALAVSAILIIAVLSLWLFGIPYMNRHMKTVEFSYSEKAPKETIGWNGKKPLVVYFTRVGNTDFEPDVDAVSGASLMIVDGELTGSNRFLADMVTDMIGCESAAITLTGGHYPSSYDDTIDAAGEELRARARPAIEPIDVSPYDQIILIYPLWWNSIPMPVATFLEQNDFGGKTIYLFATQGSSGFGRTVSEIEELAPGAKIVRGTSIYCEDIPDAQQELTELIRSWSRQ